MCPGSSLLGGKRAMVGEVEQVVDLIVSGQEALGVPVHGPST